MLELQQDFSAPGQQSSDGDLMAGKLHNLLVLLGMDGGEDEDAGDDVDAVWTKSLHQLLCCDVALKCSDMVLKL